MMSGIIKVCINSISQQASVAVNTSAYISEGRHRQETNITDQQTSGKILKISLTYCTHSNMSDDLQLQDCN